MKSADASSVTFNLSSYGLTTAGSYDITIKYTGSAWNDDKYSFTWGLYDNITGEPRGTTGTLNTAPTTVASADAKAIHITDNFYKASGTTVTPGSYVFGVYIYNGTDVIGYASDTLIVEPGRKTTATLTLDENILQTIPLAPTDFIAQKIDESVNGDFYDVRFAWTDASDNEESFELILREFEDTAATWGTFDAGATISDTTYVKVYTYSSILELKGATDRIKYVAGSLYSGSSELVLRFPTGTLWDAQIRSKNSIGTSETVARSADTAAATALEYDATLDSATSAKTTLNAYDTKKVTGYGVSTAAPFKHISLVKISYALDGGKLKTGSSETFSGTTYVEYKIYDKNTAATDDDDKMIKLLEIKTDAGEYPQLTRSNIAFSKWILPSTVNETAPAAVTYNTNTYKNILVVAVYGTTSGDIEIGTVTIQALAAASFSDTDITAYYGDSPTTAMSTNDAKNKSIKIKRGDSAQYVTVTVATNTLFKYYSLYVGDNHLEDVNYAETSVNFSNFSTDKLNDSGATCIRVDAYTAGGEKASQTFYITKTN